MIMEQLKNQISDAFSKWTSHLPDRLELLNSGSGSKRRYYRILSEADTYIATHASDIRENEAFFYLAAYFHRKGISVPELYHISSDETVYFQQDLGDMNLLQKLKSEGLTAEVRDLYKASLAELARMQTSARELDFSNCYPRASFDVQSILWDLNYFKYYFLKVSDIDFDEQFLENDFQNLAKTLVVENEPYFMFRDFQARNIQIHHGKPWFIDFQGGRRGPLLYDVASLIYQASANLPDDFRADLLEFYFQILPSGLYDSKEKYESDFRNMQLIRNVQTLGAYGFRGLIEGKEYFKNSIPNALSNLEKLLMQMPDNADISYFLNILQKLVQIKNKFENQ